MIGFNTNMRKFVHMLRSIMLPLRMLSVLLILGLVYGCDDIPNPFVNDNDRAYQLYYAGDWQAAFKLYLKVAKQGDAKAQRNLGIMYANG